MTAEELRRKLRKFAARRLYDRLHPYGE